MKPSVMRSFGPGAPGEPRIRDGTTRGADRLLAAMTAPVLRKLLRVTFMSDSLLSFLRSFFRSFPADAPERLLASQEEPAVRDRHRRDHVLVVDAPLPHLRERRL